MLDITHLLFALVLAYVLDLPVVYAMIGGVLPDVDLVFEFGFPFVHRGIVHTPVFAAFAMLVVYLVMHRRWVSASLGIGILSHLYLDTLTPMGVMWLYPVTAERFSLEIAAAANTTANLALIVFYLGTLAVWRYRTEVSRWLL